MPMSRSNYKRLGDYIREVNVRNRDLAVTRLVGLSIDKIFITSVANTIGTDMSNYKIIRKGQFACSLMQVSRDEKIPIAMLRDDEAIMSPAYPMFEVIDTAILLPEYLMMWFSRSEFDREASFYAVGGVRGSLTWEDFCNLTLPIPAIKAQREVVSEYEALSRRVALNESICDKLEQAAAALYRKTFIDNIDTQNLPHGWRMGSLTDIANYLNGLACQNYETNELSYYPVVKIRELNQGYVDENSNKVGLEIPKDFIVTHGDVLFSWSASLAIDFWCDETGVLNQHLFKVTSNKYDKWYYYLSTKHHIEAWKNLISAKATSMGHIKREDLQNAEVLIPSDDDMQQINKIMNPLFEAIISTRRENLLNSKIAKLLLSKLATN